MHPGGGEMNGSAGTGCRDGRVQRWASWGGSWWWWYSRPGGGLLRRSNHGCWVGEKLPLMNWNTIRCASWTNIDCRSGITYQSHDALKSFSLLLYVKSISKLNLEPNRKLKHYRSRFTLSKPRRIRSFHVVVLQRTAKNFPRIYKEHAVPLFLPLKRCCCGFLKHANVWREV